MQRIIAVFLLVLGLVGVAAAQTLSGYAPMNCGSPDRPAVCCLKPWIIPDRWIERSVPPNDIFDAGVDTYDTTTGYRWPGDLGTPITFIPSEGGSTAVQQSRFFALRFGPVNTGGPDRHGAKYYFRAIVGCEVYPVAFGDTLESQLGAMVGPTTRGLDSLISLDPSAYYDSTCKCIHGSEAPFPYYVRTPRVVNVAAFRPSDGLLDRRLVVVSKVLQVFIESRDDQGNFHGRIMGIIVPCPPGAAADDCLKPWLFPPGQQLMAHDPSDINGDGRTDLSDLSTLIRYLTGENTANATFDVTGDGVVDAKDLATMVGKVQGKR